MDIVVVGTGYVGLATAICLAKEGNNITAIDIDEEKIRKLQQGKTPIYEPMLEEMLKENKIKLKFTTRVKETYQNATIIFIGVGTPNNINGETELKYLFDVAKDIARNLEKDCLIVVKSTIPVGTCERLERFIIDNLKKNVKIDVVYNPEFLSQGSAVDDVLNPQRIVIGVNTEYAKQKMLEIYKNKVKKCQITNWQSAEIIKYASNSFLAVKISFINEFANLCEKCGANIVDVAKSVGMDKRIGKDFLQAGIGYGGSCLPKDTEAIIKISSKYECNLSIISSAVETNKKQQMRLIEKARKYYKNFQNVNISILGVTFKPNTDDIREAPALKNIEFFLEEGAKVKIFDPVGEEKIKIKYENNNFFCCNTIEQTIENTDICFIFTDWNVIKKINIQLFVKLMNKAIVLDGRNCFDLKDIPNGMIYESIGRKIIDKSKKI